MILSEGGNIWPESEDYEQTPENIAAIKNAAEAVLSEIGVELFLIGSGANPKAKVYTEDELGKSVYIGDYYYNSRMFKPTKEGKELGHNSGELPPDAKVVPKKSGDLDLMGEIDTVANFFNEQDPKKIRAALAQYLEQQGIQTYRAGVTVHVLVPVGDKFYQVDIKAIKKAGKVSKFHHHDLPPGSPYKGVNKQMMMNTLATMKGFLWSPDEGLYQRDAAGKKGDLLTDDLDEIAEYLLGVKDGSLLGSVESIMDAIPDPQTRQAVFDKAKASASWQAATPNVGTNEWFSAIRRMLK